MDHRFTSDFAVSHTGSTSASLDSQKAGPPAGDFCAIEQILFADNFAGRRARLSGFLRMRGVRSVGGGQLWFRVEDQHGVDIAFQNMDGRAVRGDVDWTQFTIVMDVPNNAAVMHYGALLVGSGVLWVDDLEISVVDWNTPLTKPAFVPGNTIPPPNTSLVVPVPTNLGFEETETSSQNSSALSGAQ